MSLEKTIILDESRIAHLVEERKTKLSLAIRLIDGFTDRRPMGSIEVFINEIAIIKDGREEPLRAISNPSGYHIFIDLPDGDYKIKVESDYYFEEKIEATIPLPDPLNPTEKTLKPKPSYPFPFGATLIRGMVRDLDGNAVSGAKVEVIGKEISNRTTTKGEFVLYFKALTDEDIIKEDSKRLVKGNGDKIVHLEATHNSKTGTVNLGEVEEGKVNPLESPILIN